jgi:hypothetical protein
MVFCSMEQKQIVHIIQKRFGRIQDVFRRVITHFEGSDIHAFRVEIKKLRAFLRLLATEKSRSGRLRLPKQLHRFYRLAGDIRDLQLQQEHIREAFKGNEESLPHSYLHLLRVEEATHILMAATLARNKLSIKREEKKVSSSLPHALRGRSRIRFVRMQAGRLEKLAGSIIPIQDDIQHSIRKLLKDIVYNRDHLSRETTLLLPRPLLTEGKEIKSLIEALGIFQDIRTGLGFLRERYTGPVTDEKERSTLEGLKRKWEEGQADRKKKIYTLIINSIHPLQSEPQQL